MGATVIGGPRVWGLKVDKDGWREFKVTFIVKVDDPYIDGIFVAYRATGLPPVGSQWDWGVGEVDIWSTRRPDTSVSAHMGRDGDPVEFYAVECTYSNKPGSDRCNGDETGNPLCEPNKISGRFVKYVKEATTCESIHYYTGNVLRNSINGPDAPIRNSAFEMLRGPQVEFDANRHRVVIEQNVRNLDLPLLSSMIDTLNNATLWGYDSRCIKLSDISWTQKFYGTAPDYSTYTGTGTSTSHCPSRTGCQCYITRTLEFDTDVETFDRLILDEGTKMLSGRWRNPNSNIYDLVNIDGSAPDPDNPAHFVDAVDKNGNPIRIALNGRGLPEGCTVSGTHTEGTGNILIRKYAESNFLLLGIPTTLPCS